jgi:hypothetical protein
MPAGELTVSRERRLRSGRGVSSGLRGPAQRVFKVQDGKVTPLHVHGKTLFREAFDVPLQSVLARIQQARPH